MLEEKEVIKLLEDHIRETYSMHQRAIDEGDERMRWFLYDQINQMEDWYEFKTGKRFTEYN